MAFGARIVDGTWRLCIRRGRTILYTKLSGKQEDIAFRSQAKAKACADAINAKFWKEYALAERKGFAPDCAEDMVQVIKEYMR